MKISVFSIQNTLFEGEAEKIIAQTPSGEITVLDNHLPIITSILGPQIKIIAHDKKNEISIASGFLEVRPKSEVVALVEKSS